MNLDTSDLRLRRATVAIPSSVLKRIQATADRQLEKLRREGKLRKPIPGAASIVAIIGAIFVGKAEAVTTFTETFSSDAANWGDAASLPVSWVSTGGSDGGGYITTIADFQSVDVGSGVLFRAHDEFFITDPTGSSGGAFEGNWIAENVSLFSVDVRHNAPVPVTFFSRFSTPFNFPGATAVNFAPVLPNTWTTITVPIVETNPAFVTFEGSDFASVFVNIGHIQVGVDAPDGFQTNPAPFTFDLDRAGIVAIPEPSGPVLLGLGLGLGALRRRR